MIWMRRNVWIIDEDDDRQYVFNEDQLQQIEDTERRRRASEDDEFEDSDSDDEGHPRTFKDRLHGAWKWIKQCVVPTISSATVENSQAPLGGPVFARHFKAPPGKRIPSTGLFLIPRNRRSRSCRTKSLFCK